MPGPFAPLRHPRFRGLWLAGLVSFVGTWVHNVAARWTAATLSPSPLAVSTIDTLQLLPMVLLTIAAGKVADATDRRRLLVGVHIALAALATLMGAVAWTGHLGLPELFGITACIGACGALNGPAWQATVPRQVPDEEVPAAVALMASGFNLARAVGPAAGAWMLVHVGAAWAFWTNAVSYALIGVLLWRLPPQPVHPPSEETRSPLQVPALRKLYAAVTAFGLFGMPSLSLLPVLARDTLGGEASAYGELLAAFGLGAVSVGLVVAIGAQRFGTRVWVALTCLLSAVGLALLARPGAAFVGAALCGVGWIGTLSTLNAAVQMRAPAAMRARSLAWYLTFAVAGQSTGSLLGGWIASAASLPIALQASAWGLVVVAMVTLAAGRDPVRASG